MQVNNNINTGMGSFGVRAIIITTPIPPVPLVEKLERENGMKNFNEIVKAFNNRVQSLQAKGKEISTNGLYLRTVMLFMAYAALKPDDRTVQNAKTYLLNKLDFNANSATISRNNKILRNLGLLNLVEVPGNAREKKAKLTALGEEFAKLLQ